jgi:hypothetical protein
MGEPADRRAGSAPRGSQFIVYVTTNVKPLIAVY